MIVIETETQYQQAGRSIDGLISSVSLQIERSLVPQTQFAITGRHDKRRLVSDRHLALHDWTTSIAGLVPIKTAMGLRQADVRNYRRLPPLSSASDPLESATLVRRFTLIKEAKRAPSEHRVDSDSPSSCRVLDKAIVICGYHIRNVGYPEKVSQ
nr:hypothetical protein [Modestobacter roseus]